MTSKSLNSSSYAQLSTGVQNTGIAFNEALFLTLRMSFYNLT